MYPWIFNAAAPIDPDLWSVNVFGSNGYGSINVLHAMNPDPLRMFWIQRVWIHGA